MLYERERSALAAIVPCDGLIMSAIEALHEAGGVCYLVGGTVRDIVLGLPNKDCDIEVHHLPVEIMRGVLSRFGTIITVGKAYGVLRSTGLPGVDWSVPRTDGPGRKPEVYIDTSMGIVTALRRRDLTINAMAIDMTTQELVDPFDGYDDLQKRLLRCPDAEKFVEDPLRFFRVMQFIGRFEMQPDASLNALCARMDLSAIARERIEEECKKLFLLSRSPSLGIRWLAQGGRLSEIMPELAATIGVIQPIQWHPEGDVFEHSMQALDAAAALAGDDQELKLLLCWTALAHDLGKPFATQTLADGRVTSRGHDEAGVPVARALLRRIIGSKEIINQVLLLVGHHMAPGSFVSNNAGLAAYKRLAKKIAPLSLRTLSQVATADMQGRNGAEKKPLTGPMPQVVAFVARAREAAVFDAPEVPVLTGKDFLAVCPSGPLVGKLVACAYEVQINEGVRDAQQLLRRALSVCGVKKT